MMYPINHVLFVVCFLVLLVQVYFVHVALSTKRRRAHHYAIDVTLGGITVLHLVTYLYH